MQQSDAQFSRLRWLLTLGGLFLYVGDIGTDILLALMYFNESQYIWMGLTIMFILTGMLVTQIFSYAWFRDDMKNGELIAAGRSKRTFPALHVFGMGIFTRYVNVGGMMVHANWNNHISSAVGILNRLLNASPSAAADRGNLVYYMIQ